MELEQQAAPQRKPPLWLAIWNFPLVAMIVSLGLVAFYLLLGFGLLKALNEPVPPADATGPRPAPGATATGPAHPRGRCRSAC